MEIIVEGEGQGPYAAMVREWTEKILVAQLLPASTEIGVLFAGRQKIGELNAEYRGKEAPTDVLSFPIFQDLEELSAEVDFLPDGQPLLIGDIVVCIDVAAENARSDGIPLEQELRLLVVHGILHLLGFDHEGESELEKQRAAEMRQRESELLSLLSGQ